MYSIVRPAIFKNKQTNKQTNKKQNKTKYPFCSNILLGQNYSIFY